MSESRAIDEAEPVTTTVVESISIPTYTGSHSDWMAQAGISESDYTYVDYIISHESSWNPSAINAGSGACGLPQALPCSKLGDNWSNPITALQWANTYATDRYGSWYAAYQFWITNKWW